ncbi:Sterol 3-beta-glucosyltransferase UGT80B1 [Escovopsis weberi]|uniref:Sterol 3-beta-glucosyltransferase UGT80B1 n=1 Tax=Escovopsis weberi TaxID=150374 RepID=A0A0M8N782_ESCWE|nr:Sterol 3-beta-glucosyltransferase UGT80B1 [Escovopsis weberi]
MDRIRSNVDSELTVDRASSGAGGGGGAGDEARSSLGDDGRFVVHFHHDAKSLAAWFRRSEKSGIRRPQRHPRDLPGTAERGTFTAGPRLNIAIHVVGSRGDVQPFIPIAQLLAREPYSYRVRICTHPVFKEFVESQGVDFFSIGGDPEALMAYMVKNPGLLPSRESVRAGDVGRRREEMWEIINGAWRSCIEAGDGMSGRLKAARVRNVEDLFVADAIIANPPSMAHIHCAEKLGIPLHMVFTMPWSPTETFAHPLTAMHYGKADAKTANYLSFVIMELLTWQGLGDLINKFRDQKLGLDPISPMWGFQLLSRLGVPFDYLWSESLIPKPPDWGPNINISGFSFLPLGNGYRPPPGLVKFLGKGPPPIYVGFGSIVVDNPGALTDLVFEAVSIAGVRAVVSRGWGLVGTTGEEDDVPENICLVDNCPHDWLFKRVSIVVHHGGAGTTAAGIKNGRPTVVVPFFGDQRFWGETIARAGAGPEPVPIKQMTAETLAAGIAFCQRPETKLAAQKMAQSIAHEDGAFDAVRDFKSRLDPGQFRCDLCPQRLAAWRHKKTNIHLSGFAVACLADKGILKPADVRILQRKHWYVDEGAENPLVGIAAAFTCFIAAIAIATSDFWRGLKSQRHPDGPPESRASVASQPSQDSLSINILGDDDADSEMLHRFSSHSGLRRLIPGNSLSPGEMETLALKLARRSVRGIDPAENVKRSPSFHDKQVAAWRGREKGRNGRPWYVARLTGRYAIEVGRAGLKAPTAFFYNVANGFHNFPSYGFAGVEVRRRDQITGFESGLSTAGKEFVMGMWTAVTGVVLQPYQTIRNEGGKGTGKGLWRGVKGLVSNVGAAMFGLPGYTLKGVEKECSKRHLTKLKAEIILIRLRQAIDDFRRATPAQREEVITRWNELTR